MSDKLLIDIHLAQKILNYLIRQPYADVFELVQGLQSLAPPTNDKDLADD